MLLYMLSSHVKNNGTLNQLIKLVHKLINHLLLLQDSKLFSFETRCCVCYKMITSALWFHVMLISFPKSYVIYMLVLLVDILAFIKCIILLKNVSIGITCALTLTASVKRVLSASKTKCQHKNQLACYNHCLFHNHALNLSQWISLPTCHYLMNVMPFLASLTVSVNL